MKSQNHQNKTLIFVISIIAAMGGFLFGFDTGVISGALNFLQDPKGWGISDFDLGWVTTAVLIGAVLGCLISGRITDILGRKRIIIATSVIFMFGAIASGSAPNVEILIISRIILGIVIGIASFSVPLYIAEISPARHRGALVCLNQLMITIGILVSYISDYWFANDADPFSWRMMFHIGFIPGFILFAGMFFLPETPRWLISKGKEEKGKNILEKVEDPDLVDETFNKMKEEIALDAKTKITLKQLFSPWLKFPLIIGIGIMVYSEFTGIDTIVYYTPKIFKIAGYISNEQAILPAIIIGLANVLFTIVSIFLLDKIGRRPLYLIGLAGMVINLAAMGTCFYFQNSLGIFFSYCTIISMILFIISFAISFGPLGWLLISEIFPLKLRGLGMSVSSIANWASNMTVNFLFLKVVNVISLSGAFWTFSLIGLSALIWGYYYIPETKGKSLEMIEEHWRKGKSPREL
jgi:MFS transporter, SP family, galactose:H+ symporter